METDKYNHTHEPMSTVESEQGNSKSVVVLVGLKEENVQDYVFLSFFLSFFLSPKFPSVEDELRRVARECELPFRPSMNTYWS